MLKISYAYMVFKLGVRGGETDGRTDGRAKPLTRPIINGALRNA